MIGMVQSKSFPSPPSILRGVTDLEPPISSGRSGSTRVADGIVDAVEVGAASGAGWPPGGLARPTKEVANPIANRTRKPQAAAHHNNGGECSCRPNVTITPIAANARAPVPARHSFLE